MNAMMEMDRQEAISERLREAGLRPTRQRVALADLLYATGPRHVSAEQLHDEARRAGNSISLATVYNALHQFTAAGLLREVLVEPGRVYFDTNTSVHHHFFYEDSGQITDIEPEDVSFDKLPAAPDGHDIADINVIVRVRTR